LSSGVGGDDVEGGDEALEMVSESEKRGEVGTDDNVCEDDMSAMLGWDA
jgi:hypothetical protein